MTMETGWARQKAKLELLGSGLSDLSLRSHTETDVLL